MKRNTTSRPGLTTVQIKPELLLLMAPYLKRGMTKAEIINTALRQHLIEQEMEDIRRQLVPLAQAQGIFTDEDVERRLK